MKFKWVFVMAMLTCSAAQADCLDQQREVNRLKSEAMKDPGAMTTFALGGCVTREIRAYLKTHAAFVRRCYAELGLTRLQAESGAMEDEASIAQQGACK